MSNLLSTAMDKQGRPAAVSTGAPGKIRHDGENLPRSPSDGVAVVSRAKNGRILPRIWSNSPFLDSPELDSCPLILLSPRTNSERRGTENSELQPSKQSSNSGQSDHFLSDLYRSVCGKFQVEPVRRIIDSLRCDRMEIRHRALGPTDVKALSVTLLSNPYVTWLDLHGNQIGSGGARHLSELLQENSFIRNLALANNDIGNSGLFSLCVALESNTSLKMLNVFGNCIDEAGANFISSLLRSNSDLEELNISHNRIGRLGGSILGQALSTNSTLRVLDVSWNHIRLDGAERLCASLQSNIGLEVLNLRFNGLDIDGCVGFEHSLPQNKKLVALDISSNRIDIHGLRRLSAGLKKNRSLEVLHIGDNPIRKDQTVTILRALQKSSTLPLRELHLAHIPVDLRFVEELEALRESRDLQVTHDVISQSRRQDADTNGYSYVLDPLLKLMIHVQENNMRLLDIFAKMDSNNDGRVDFEELLKGLEHADVTTSTMDVKALLKKLDLNSDGLIDFHEFVSGTKTTKRKAIQMKTAD